MKFRLQLYQGKYLVLGYKHFTDWVWLTNLLGPEGESAPSSPELSKAEFEALPWVTLVIGGAE